MTRKEELLVDGCKLIGLSNDETLLVFQLLRTEEEFSDMLDWLIKNIKSRPKPIYIIMAAGEIQEKYQKKNATI